LVILRWPDLPAGQRGRSWPENSRANMSFANIHMTEKDAASKPWGGRFTESTDAFVEAFTASIEFDKRLYRHDISG
jgi:hypothetical protein